MAAPHLQTIVPTSRSLMERALDPCILLGMPHLTPFGLSETWLMKELGHRHWLMLAIRLGMDNADFRTADNREAYASICASALDQIDGGLPTAKPNDILEIRSSFSFLAGHRHSSLHMLKIGGWPICKVELISTFVARQTEADNHTLARIEQPGPRVLQVGTSELASVASVMRRTAAARQNSTAEGERYFFQRRFSTSPGQDFNGAGLLYFANFQNFVAQAISQAALDHKRFKRLEVFFFGNIRADEDITVCLRTPSDLEILSADIVREDGRIIAVARYLSTKSDESSSGINGTRLS